ncbi:MAG: hypothetical protein ACFFG0_02875 [Candidatus Thorarchaeota archaeon]
MKPITQEEHNIIIENALILEKKVNHPIDLGDTQLMNIIRCMRALEDKFSQDNKGGKA